MAERSASRAGVDWTADRPLNCVTAMNILPTIRDAYARRGGLRGERSALFLYPARLGAAFLGHNELKESGAEGVAASDAIDKGCQTGRPGGQYEERPMLEHLEPLVDAGAQRLRCQERMWSF